MKIIDIHTHNTVTDTEFIIEAASRNKIKHIVLLGDVLKFGLHPDESQICELNNDTITKVRKHPKTCFGFCFLNPANDLDFTLREIDRCINKHGFKGVKLEISLNCRSERLYPIMQKLEELDVPLLHHCWYKTISKFPEESDPSDIACLARRFPAVKIIMAHLTGCGYRGVEDIVNCPNVYVDTSGGQPVAGMVEYAVRRLGPSRIIFGSDAPYRDISCQMGRIYGADLTCCLKRKIFFDNAEELLKL